MATMYFEHFIIPVKVNSMSIQCFHLKLYCPSRLLSLEELLTLNWTHTHNWLHCLMVRVGEIAPSKCKNHIKPIYVRFVWENTYRPMMTCVSCVRNLEIISYILYLIFIFPTICNINGKKNKD